MVVKNGVTSTDEINIGLAVKTPPVYSLDPISNADELFAWEKTINKNPISIDLLNLF